MTEVTTEQRRNGYADEDFRDVLAEIEQADEEAEEIMASARGKVSKIRERQKNRIKIADKQLNIPPDVLRAVLKQRKLERKLEALAEGVGEDLIEVFEDAAGQFSLFKPEEGAPAVPVAQAAARKAADTARVHEEAEQVEGERVLDELAGAGAMH